MTLPSPKHSWNFNEISGTTAADSAGGAVISLDRAAWVPGRLGNAIRFNPKDGVKLATTSLAEMPPPWTAGFWVKREADSEGASLFSSNSFALKLEQWGSPHQVGFTKFTTASAKGFDPSFGYTIPLNQWVHLALVGTTGGVALYVNGVKQGSLQSSEPINLGLRWLGSSMGYVEFASALLDEIKIFDQALTDEQVGELAMVSQTVDFTTGKAAWVVVSAPPNSGFTPGPAPLVTSSWASTPPGAQLIGNNGQAPIGEYIFELSFTLGAAFSSPDGQIDVLADDYATILLNDTQVGATATNSQSWLKGAKPAVVQFASCANLLRAGENKLRVKVNNLGGPTGFYVTGSLKVT